MPLLLFLIPRTPLEFRSPVREALWNLSKATLIAQSCDNWVAVIVGDTRTEPVGDPRFIVFDMDKGTKIDKLSYALSKIEIGDLPQPRYIVRLDDDDIFSPDILREIQVSGDQFDCFSD